MKKYIPSQEQLNLILKMYNEELLGSQTISQKLKIGKQVVLRILKEHGVTVGSQGRRYLGGKKMSDKKYYIKNKKNKSEYYKIWYENNKENVKNYLKEYREKNINKIREIKRNYERVRKSKDPIYKLINNFRTAIYQVLKENNIKKNGHYFDILKYTPNELINHLEKQFKNGMTWDNYGKWHVDHKIPISSYNIRHIGDDEFMLCWSLDNLQPLWGEENIKKSNKII
jgi:hypothetical protein